jgi:hypothetical protein
MLTSQQYDLDFVENFLKNKRMKFPQEWKASAQPAGDGLPALYRDR